LNEYIEELYDGENRPKEEEHAITKLNSNIKAAYDIGPSLNIENLERERSLQHGKVYTNVSRTMKKLLIA